MEQEKFFAIFSSKDGEAWITDPADDSENYWHIARKARERSITSGHIERIVRLDSGKVIIAYRNDMPDADYYTP